MCNVGALIYGGKVVRQPGDGSCLFHSISYGLRDGSDANSLRAEICQFIQRNPEYKISETPLSDWVKVGVCYILYNVILHMYTVIHICIFPYNMYIILVHHMYYMLLCTIFANVYLLIIMYAYCI